MQRVWANPFNWGALIVILPSFILLGCRRRGSEPDCLLRGRENIVIHNARCRMYANKSAVWIFEAGVMSWLCSFSPWINATTFPVEIRGKTLSPALVWTLCGLFGKIWGPFCSITFLNSNASPRSHRDHTQPQPVQNIVCVLRFKNVPVKHSVCCRELTYLYPQMLKTRNIV